MGICRNFHKFNIIWRTLLLVGEVDHKSREGLRMLNPGCICSICTQRHGKSGILQNCAEILHFFLGSSFLMAPSDFYG